MELDLISSITSTNIRKITFTQRVASKGQTGPDHPNWTQLDNSLCRLVDRLESGLRLEVEFRAVSARAWWNEELGFKKYLPRFYEKGEADGGWGR